MSCDVILLEAIGTTKVMYYVSSQRNLLVGGIGGNLNGHKSSDTPNVVLTAQRICYIGAVIPQATALFPLSDWSDWGDKVRHYR
jgi:hypothetical protein